MKRIFILSIIVLFSISINAQKKEILNKTITKLNSLKSLEYELVSQDVLKSLDRNRIDSAYCYFDFTSKDTLIGAKYQFISKYGEMVFDGNLFFNSDNEQEHVLYNDQPTKREVISNIFMINSLLVLKKTLPELLIDSSTYITKKRDSLLNNTECYQFKISITEKFIGMGGELTKMSGKEIDTMNYLLLVSKETYLPTQFTTIYSNNNGFFTSTFNNFKDVTPKNDSIWSYERMPRGYMRSTVTDYFKGMRAKNKDNIGLKAPDWTLPMVEGDSIKLSKITNNLVLLEFWFPYCKGCVQAVPELNKIYKKYKDNGLSMYGIEFTKKSEQVLVEYIEKQKIQFATLFRGKDISKDYKVYAAPTFFLIDKNGKIIYTSVGFNKEKLINAIDENI